MNDIRSIFTPKNGQLLIDIPREYKQKRFEIIVIPIEESEEESILKAKMDAFVKTLPANEPDISEAEIILEIKSVRQENQDRRKN